MAFESTLKWLQDLSFATQVRESDWLFPTIETVHVFALTLVVGSIMMVDLRLMGLSNRERPFSELAAEMLPWTWVAFAVAAIAGFLMFSSKALIYSANIPFRLKMGCMLLAGINMAAFHLVGTRHVHIWDKARPPPPARVAGAVSLILWTTIVAAGRWVGFTT